MENTENVDTSARGPDPRLTFETVHEMLNNMEEQVEYARRARERQIMQQVDLDLDRFKEHRNELIRLYDCFEFYDSDRSGYLSQKEAKQLLKHVGLQPYRPPSRAAMVSKFLQDADPHGHQGLNFPEFLTLISQVRKVHKRMRDASLRYQFRSLANTNGRLDIDTVDAALVAAGIGGRTQEAKETQRNIIYDGDVDNSGDISYDEFASICQRVQERRQHQAMEQIIQFATSVGIERRRLADYMCAFDQHDIHDNGTLGLDAIDEALRALSIRPSGDALQELFARLDIRRDQQVPLMKFLEVMHEASSARMKRQLWNTEGEVA
jgi:Ca2+-binding EF-hand superfamily protein